MAIYCDDCGTEFNSLSDVEEYDGEILCDECIEFREDCEDDEEDEEDEQPTSPSVLCPGCHTLTNPRNMIEKNEHPRGLCVKCAHRFELNLFIPPDHEAATCQLCNR